MEESGYVRKVEMLDTESEQWYTLASLPQASTDLSISLCSRNLYIIIFSEDGPAKIVLKP